MGETPTLAEDPEEQVDGEEPEEQVDGEDSQATVDDAADVLDDQPANDASEVNEETVELTDDDLGGGLFSGVEEGDDGGSSSGTSDDSDDSDDAPSAEDIADGLEGNAAAMEGAINEGAARLATVGLTESDFEDSELTKDGLEEEFAETFEAFRLGYFGSRAAEKYVLEPADGDVSPAWGLAGSMLMAVGMTVWLRPDGDEAISKVRDAVEGITGGGT